MKTEKKEYITPAIAEIEIGNAALYSVSSTGSNVDFSGNQGSSQDASAAMTSQWTMPWDDINTEAEGDY